MEHSEYNPGCFATTSRLMCESDPRDCVTRRMVANSVVTNRQDTLTRTCPGRNSSEPVRSAEIQDRGRLPDLSTGGGLSRQPRTGHRAPPRDLPVRRGHRSILGRGVSLISRSTGQATAPYSWSMMVWTCHPTPRQTSCRNSGSTVHTSGCCLD